MKEALLEIFNSESFNKPLDVDELYELLNLSTPNDFTQLAKALNALEDEFIITHNKKGCFALLSFFNLCVGVLDVKDGGFGFVDTPDGGIFVREVNLKGAITYDYVMIKTTFDEYGRLEGVVERIIKRGNDFFYGELLSYRKKFIVRSIDNKIKLTIFIKKEDLNKAKPHDMVKVKVNKYYPNNTADGSIISVMGKAFDPGLDITSLVLSSNVLVDFREETILETNEIDDFVNSSDLDNRIDLTNKLIITIDGDDAKDLDDAISVEKLENGNYLLGVYIADVSHYVKEGTFLDLDAYERSTSIYLPDRVIPMLPKKLSNGICSLNENVIRLVMACEMEINHQGEVVNSSIFEAYIKTKHRMTYNDVNKILNDDEDLVNKYQDIYKLLKDANHLAYLLKEKRSKRGAFFFESPESKLILDDLGKVLDIVLRDRKDAEELIEEFMLAANETVAEQMKWLDVPFIYRVHENPKEDKIIKLMMLVESFGLKYKINNQKSIQRVLQTILSEHDLNEEGIDDAEKIRRGIINNALIRTMAKAKYQETNIGHFGLASKCYTHFTSPIRRYPDLLVHRLIKEFMLNNSTIKVVDKVGYYNGKVNQTGIYASKKERIAEKLERDCVDYKKCEYMENFVGHSFIATISSITSHGIYLTLSNTVEGIALYKDMYDDYYEYDERLNTVIGTKTKTIYRLGDLVRVRVMNASKKERNVYFRILRKEPKNESRK